MKGLIEGKNERTDGRKGLMEEQMKERMEGRPEEQKDLYMGGQTDVRKYE